MMLWQEDNPKDIPTTPQQGDYSKERLSLSTPRCRPQTSSDEDGSPIDEQVMNAPVKEKQVTKVKTLKKNSKVLFVDDDKLEDKRTSDCNVFGTSIMNLSRSRKPPVPCKTPEQRRLQRKLIVLSVFACSKHIFM